MRRFLGGLMAGLPRVNCWTLAEHAGETSPGGMRHFLAGAVWDDDGLRTDLRDYVTTATRQQIYNSIDHKSRAGVLSRGCWSIPGAWWADASDD
jgi:SRSO17 transposase